MQPLHQRDPFIINTVQVFLHVAEHTTVTREGECHGTKLLKNLVPVFDTELPLVGGDGGNDFLEAGRLVGGQA